jgi:hypothetical protein
VIDAVGGVAYAAAEHEAKTETKGTPFFLILNEIKFRKFYYFLFSCCLPYILLLAPLYHCSNLIFNYRVQITKTNGSENFGTRPTSTQTHARGADERGEGRGGGKRGWRGGEKERAKEEEVFADESCEEDSWRGWKCEGANKGGDQEKIWRKKTNEIQEDTGQKINNFIYIFMASFWKISQK